LRIACLTSGHSASGQGAECIRNQLSHSILNLFNQKVSIQDLEGVQLLIKVLRMLDKS
jgi:hypothetical protein